MKTTIIVCFFVLVVLLILTIIAALYIYKSWQELKEERDRLDKKACEVGARETSIGARRARMDKDEAALIAKGNELRVLEDTLGSQAEELMKARNDLDEAKAEFEKNCAEIYDKAEAFKKEQDKRIAYLEGEIAKREKELKDRKADVITREAVLGLMGVPEAADIIEPVEEPQKVAFGTTEKKRCPRCGKDMEMKTDVCYTSIPPQYKYICPECGREEVDTCPPTHNLVGTDKKPVKKAKKGGKK